MSDESSAVAAVRAGETLFPLARAAWLFMGGTFSILSVGAVLIWQASMIATKFELHTRRLEALIRISAASCEMLEQIGVVQQRGGALGAVQQQDLSELNLRLAEVRKACRSVNPYAVE